MPKHHVLNTCENDNIAVFTRHHDIRRQSMAKAPLITCISKVKVKVSPTTGRRDGPKGSG